MSSRSLYPAVSTDEPSDVVVPEGQSFVLRLRLERPYLPGPPGTGPEPTPPRVQVRIEDVSAHDITNHSTVEAALEWLSRRLLALVRVWGGQAHPDPPGDRPTPRP